MLPDAFAKAVKNLFLPSIMKLFLICLLVYLIGGILLSMLLSSLVSVWAGLAGAEGVAVGIASGVGGFVVAWFLFPLMYPILVSFFDDHMAEVIEREDYPGLPVATPPFWPTLGQDVWFSVKAIGLNLLCIPIYIIPLIGWLVYYGLNGYLLGMQFFRMSAGRRASQGEVEQLVRKQRGAIVLAGVTISFCATIPVLNLAAPLLGVATMLHLFHAMRRTDRVVILSEQ